VVGTHTHVATADEQILPEEPRFKRTRDDGAAQRRDRMDKTAILRRFLDGQQRGLKWLPVTFR